MPKPGELIQADAYPQMVHKSEVAAVARMLKSPETLARGNRAAQGRMAGLRAVVQGYIAELEEAGPDLALAHDKAREIRSFAETAGLGAAGHIADGLCRYFDESAQRTTTPDSAVVGLHVAAIARAASAKDEASRMSGVVAKELAVLVNRRLTEVKTSL